MKMTRFFLPLVLVLAISCGNSKPDYSEFYKPDPSDKPEEPENPGLQENQIKITSFNVRYSSADDGANNWENRKVAVPAMFVDQQPTLLGVQEARLDQKTFMDENCMGYKSIGVGRTDGRNAGEFMAIYYLEKAVQLDKWGTFWLSETPDKPSKGWDASTYRTATWGLFTHLTSGKKLLLVNTHIDHVGQTAALESMKLIEAKIKTLNPENYPVVITADFNKLIDSPIFEGVKRFMSNARQACPSTDNKASYNAFGGATSYGQIDHIFFSSVGFSPLRFQTIDTRYKGVPYISDHFPISTVLEFK